MKIPLADVKVRARASFVAGCLCLAVALAPGASARGQAAAPVPCSEGAKAAGNCPAASVPAQIPAQIPAKSAAQRFPYPGESPSAADRPADVPAESAPDFSTPAARSSKTPLPPYPGDPDAPAPSLPRPSRTAPQPYPGDPDAPAGSGSGGSSDSSSSSSSSSSSNSSTPGASPDSPDNPGPLADAGSSGDATRVPIRNRKKLAKIRPETPESRAAEDLTVAEFYQNDGNYAAAYLRAKDAVENQPTDPYTHFALAEAANKLGKTGEAKAQYEEVLKLDPIPKQLKATRKALAEIASAEK